MVELKKEQSQAVMHEKGDMLVSASAGSGKTFVMISRLIRLITEGKANVDEILAVTFTEAAATDMKLKLKKALLDKIAVTDNPRLTEQLLDVDIADISTLHSFCSRLIRSYFFVAGVAPDYKIADTDQSQELKRTAINSVFKDMYSVTKKGEGDLQGIGFRKLVIRHSRGRNDKNLRETVLNLFEYSQTEAEPELFLDSVSENYTLDGFNATLTEYKRYLDERLGNVLSLLDSALHGFLETGYPQLSEKCKDVLEDAKKVYGSNDIYAFLEFKDYDKKINCGRIKPEAVEFRELSKQALKEFKTIIDGVCKCLYGREIDFNRYSDISAHTVSLNELVKRFGKKYAELKAEENVLDFNDLEHFALKVLLDDTARESIKSKYKYIFVDEYQDTNGVQDRILSLISDDNTFMVGDVKQSIYGFRGCKPELFQDKFDKMTETGGQTVLLNHNFRSADKVIDVVNKVFDFSMTKKSSGIDYRTTSQLVAGGIYDDEHKGRAEIHLLKPGKSNPLEKEEPRVYDVLEELSVEDDGEATLTAKLITEIINKELAKTYYDTAEKKEKQVRYGDIAILTRNKSNDYVSALVSGLIRHNIPVSSDCAESICDYPEIRLMISALSIIDCFSQDIHLATVLKSPIGGLTDEDLLKICRDYDLQNPKKIYGRSFYDAFVWYKENGEQPLRDKIVEFDTYFSDLRLLSDFESAHEVMSRIVKDKNLESHLYAGRMGEHKVKRLRCFISASDIGGKRFSVKEFLTRIENNPDLITLGESLGEDTVRVMTIHASKGLEFPVTIVCGLERRVNTHEEIEEILKFRALGYALKYYDDDIKRLYETPLRGLMREKMRESRVKEELRLFYVALTRATYSLHLTFVTNNDDRSIEFTGANKFLHYVPSYLPVTEHVADEFDLVEQKSGIRKVLIGNAQKELTEKMRSDFSFEYPFLADTTLPIKSSVTAVSANDRTEYYKAEKIFDDEVSVSATLGTNAHRIMELFDFNRADDFDGEIKRLLDQGFITKDTISGLDLKRISFAVKGETFAKIKDKTLYREQSFLINFPANLVFDTESKAPVLVQGIIDLLVLDGDYATVIDYKYSALDGQSLKNKYKKQLELYAYAVEKCLGKKVKDKFIVSLLTGETVKID